MIRNMQQVDRSELTIILERIEIIERKIDALLNALADEDSEAKPDPLASLDQGQPLDLGSDWATL